MVFVQLEVVTSGDGQRGLLKEIAS